MGRSGLPVAELLIETLNPRFFPHRDACGDHPARDARAYRRVALFGHTHQLQQDNHRIVSQTTGRECHEPDGKHDSRCSAYRELYRFCADNPNPDDRTTQFTLSGTRLRQIAGII